MKHARPAAQNPSPARKLELCYQHLKELENLLHLHFRSSQDQADRIRASAYGITYHAPHDGIAELARLMRDAARTHDLRLMDSYFLRLKTELDAVARALAGDPGELQHFGSAQEGPVGA